MKARLITTGGATALLRRAWLVCALSLSACSPDLPVLPGAGEWRLVNYWAIWCTPCREEIPALNRVDQRSGVRVLGVNFDGKIGDELELQAQQLGIDFELLAVDPGPALDIPRPSGLPVTAVVNPAGKVVMLLEGPQTEASLLAALDDAQSG